jgi:hypothetical protein
MIYYRKTLFGSGPKLTAVHGESRFPLFFSANLVNGAIHGPLSKGLGNFNINFDVFSITTPN